MIRFVMGPEFLTSPPEDFIEDMVTGERLQPGNREWESWSSRVEEVVVGYGPHPDLDFLRHFPSARKVTIRTPSVKDLGGLRYLKHLRELAINRPTARFDVLGELTSLEDLYLDGWRPGAESIFDLYQLRKLGIQKFGLPDLSRMEKFTRLESLWLNAGKLVSLTGIPNSVRELEVYTNRNLDSLVPLRGCPRLRGVNFESVRLLHSLEGLEASPLEQLRLFKTGMLEAFEALAGKDSLTWIFLGSDCVSKSTDFEAFYTLRNLASVSLPSDAPLDVDRLKRAAPAVEVRLY
jgi:hypothetical protein